MTVSKQFPFEKIVVAADCTNESSCVLRYAEAIARRHGAQLVPVTVPDPMGYAFPDGVEKSVSVDPATREEMIRIESEMRRHGLQVHSAAETENICNSLVDKLNECDGKLLILGTRVSGKAGCAALAMVARRLLGKTGCPILTVPPRIEALIPSAGRWREVLLATDFSPCSLTALRAAHRIAHAHFVVLHASNAGSEAERRGFLERLRFLAPMDESHTVPVEHVILPGDAGRAIVNFAQKHPADLVVLGSPEKNASEEELRTSTVVQVISEVECPVLCIPASQTMEMAGSLRESQAA